MNARFKKKKDKGTNKSVQAVKSISKFATREQQSKFENWIFSKYSFQKKNRLINLCKRLSEVLHYFQIST